jgi:hypothetical protein
MTEEDEEFERIAAKCKETQRVNESKWRSEMCSNYGGFCKKEWVGLTDEEMKKTWYEMQNIMGWYSFEEIAKAVEAKLMEKNRDNKDESI